MQCKGVEGIKTAHVADCVCVCHGLCNHLNVNATLIDLLLRPFLFCAPLLLLLNGWMNSFAASHLIMS